MSVSEGATQNLVSISPFFIVKDLTASIAFYRDRLGFQLDFHGPADDVYDAGVRWDAYIYTLDPDTLYDEFRQRGVPFVKELSFIDEGLWGFEIADDDEYVIAFFRRNELGY